MTEYLQAVSTGGYIIHAVPADRPRHGLWDQYVMGTTACKKLRGRDAQGSPSLQLQFDRSSTDGRQAKPFSRNADDFEVTRGARRICSDCARVLTP